MRTYYVFRGGFRPQAVKHNIISYPMARTYAVGFKARLIGTFAEERGRSRVSTPRSQCIRIFDSCVENVCCSRENHTTCNNILYDIYCTIYTLGVDIQQQQ